MIRWFTTYQGVKVLQQLNYYDQWEDVPEVTEAQYEMEIDQEKERQQKRAELINEQLKGKTYTVR